MKHRESRARGGRIREILDEGVSKALSDKDNHFASILPTTSSFFASCQFVPPTLVPTHRSDEGHFLCSCPHRTVLIGSRAKFPVVVRPSMPLINYYHHPQSSVSLILMLGPLGLVSSLSCYE